MPSIAPSCSPTGGPQPTEHDRAQWLVSVRNLDEAQLAVDFGVDIVDLKEPLDGALPPVSAKTWLRVCRWATEFSNHHQAGVCLSAALGEPAQAATVAARLPAQFSYAKVGPSGCRHESQLNRTWDAIRQQLPPSVELVAVAYADHRAAHCLPADQILELAARSGFRRILLDTFEKTHGSVVSTWGGESLGCFGALAHEHRLWWSLAGSITLGHLQQIETLIPQRESRPNCFAVRGDVCQSERTGNLCPERLRAWATALNLNAASASAP